VSVVHLKQVIMAFKHAPISFLVLLLALASAVLGNPGCNRRDKVVSKLLASKTAASSYCSSYLSIPEVTITAPTVTTTVFITTTSASTVTPLTTTQPPGPLATYLSQFRPRRISSACSCLSIPESTTTLTPTTTFSLCTASPSPTAVSLSAYCYGDVAYCAAGSGGSPIILRCTSGNTLQPGNCDDNLGEPVNGALCIQSGPLAGNAVCSAVGSPMPVLPTPTGGIAQPCCKSGLLC